LRAAAQLRRQLGQVQGTNQVAGEATADVDSATAEPKSGAAKAKQKQKAKGQSAQE
jgi:hypothetical protein